VAGCLLSLGRVSEALPPVKKALAIRQKSLGEAHPDTAASYNNAAECLRSLGRASEALPLSRKGLAATEQALGDGHPHTATGYNNVALCLQDLGRASEALVLLEKALAIRQKTLGEAHRDTAAGYNNVASCLRALGKAREALPLYKKALAIWEKTSGESHPDTAVGYDNVAVCLERLGEPRAALPLYKKALAIRQKALGEAHPDTATSSVGLASCLVLLGKGSEALPLFEKALAVHEKALGKTHPTTAASYENVANCLKSLGKGSEALPLFEKALAIKLKAQGEAHPGTPVGHNHLALCLHALGKYTEAARHFRAASLGWESGRRNAGDTGFDRSLFRVEAVHPRPGLAACLVREGKAADAWAQAEAYLARGLLEDLEADRGDEDRERLARLAALNARLLPLLTRSELSRAERKEFDSIREQRSKLDAEMAKAVAVRSDARLLSIARVQKQIPADAAIVLWIDVRPLNEHLACVVRDKGDPAWVRLPGSDKGDKWTRDDWSLADRAQEALQKPGDAAERARLLTALHKQRIAPLEKHLKGVKRLLVVPTGRMAQVPVEALTDKYTVCYVPSGSVYAKRMEDHRALKGDGLFVLADPTFIATPPEPPKDGVMLSAVVPGGIAALAGLQPGDVLLKVGKEKVASFDDLVAALKQPLPLDLLVWRDGKEIDRRLTVGGRLGIAVDKRPARDAVLARRKEQERFASRGDWKQLPGTRVEMELLKGMVARHTLLAGKDATEQRLEEMADKGELKKSRLLHLATHGEPNKDVPLQSALILSQHKTPTLDENLARAKAGKRELTNRLTVESVLRTWKLDADLVTLSACETGIGGDGGGEGMLGFAQALLQKGARSVLLSRWKVDDAATSLLMWRFYQNVLGQRDDKKPAMKRADALHEAKAWLRKLPRSEAEKALAKITDSIPRGERGKVGRLPDKKGDAPKEKDDLPFEQPYYWAAFVLIGDPD
jgi:CHAT domain-containing protein